MHDRTRFNKRFGLFMGLIWLVYMVYPLSALLSSHRSSARLWQGGLGLVLFLAVYVWYWIDPLNRTERQRFAVGLAFIGFALATTDFLHMPTMFAMVVYAGPVFAMCRDKRLALLGLSVGTASALWIDVQQHLGNGYLLSVLLPFLTVSLAMWVYTRMWRMSWQLQLAKEEVEALAAANERLRISRDLHDVMGHNLSAIALRAELAAHKAGLDAASAADEMRQVAEIARRAIADVRQVITGYRDITLAGEWANGAKLLESSGIQCHQSGVTRELPSSLDRTLGFVVREALTNVLRHSRATQCDVLVEALDDAVVLRVDDNGMGAPSPSPIGHGLAGLRERISNLGGSVEWSAPDARGFRLTVRLPKPS